MKKRTKIVLGTFSIVGVGGIIGACAVSCSSNKTNNAKPTIVIPNLFNTGVNANLKNIYNQQVTINKTTTQNLTTNEQNTDLTTFINYLQTNSPESIANNNWVFAYITYAGSYMAYNYYKTSSYFSSVFTWFPIWNLAYFLQCTQVNGSIAKHTFLDSFINLVNNNLISAKNTNILTSLNNGLEQYLQSALNNNLLSNLQASLLKVIDYSFDNKTDYLSLTLQYDNSNKINTGVYLTNDVYTKNYDDTFKPFYHQIKRYGDYVYNYDYNNNNSSGGSDPLIIPMYYPS